MTPPAVFGEDTVKWMLSGNLTRLGGDCVFSREAISHSASFASQRVTLKKQTSAADVFNSQSFSSPQQSEQKSRCEKLFSHCSADVFEFVEALLESSSQRAGGRRPLSNMQPLLRQFFYLIWILASWWKLMLFCTVEDKSKVVYQDGAKSWL